LLSLAAAAGAAQGRPPAATVRAEAPVTIVQSQEVRTSGVLDLGQIAVDPARAAETLLLLDSLEAQSPPDSAQRAHFRGMRATLLAAMSRRAESGAIIDEIAAGRFDDLSVYDQSLRAAMILQDARRAVALIEAAARNIGSSRPEQIQALSTELVFDIVGKLDRQNDQEALTRFYQALVSVDWPGDGDPSLRDAIRISLIDVRLERGDRAGAAALASRITAPARVLRLIALKRYDGLFPAGADRQALVRSLFEETDRATAAGLAAHPGDVRTILNRVEFLQSLGRDEEALALLQPYLGDVAATANINPMGMWLIEYGAYALLARGRGDEAVALFARLAELPVPDQPALPGPLVNHTTFLWQAGRYAEALARAQLLAREEDARLDDQGRASLWSAMACALAGLNRTAEARPWLERMEAIRDSSPMQLMRAYLCIGDLAAAEAFALHRLASSNAESAVMGLQDWQRPEAPGEPAASIEARFAELRRRPAVAGALARTGHLLVLPANRTYWGGF